MPNPTTNYAWAVPIVGGSGGAWGTILNAFADSIDSTVKLRQNEAAAALAAAVVAEAENLTFPPIGAARGQISSGSAATALAPNGYTLASIAGDLDLYIPLTNLATGHQIDSIRSYGRHVSGTNVATIALIRVSKANVITVVSAGHVLPGALAETVTSGIAHAVIADEQYFIRCRLASGGTGNAELFWVQPGVSRP